MPDYSKTTMYKLVSDNLPPEMVYYGHTTGTLSKRLSTHVYYALHDTQGNYTSRVIIEAGAYRIVRVEDWPCANKTEARARERWWIENSPCVNEVIPFRTEEEKKAYKKLYDADNADKRAAYYKENSDIEKKNSKNRYEKNREVILTNGKKRVVCCVCKIDLRKSCFPRHRHTCYKRFCDAFGIDAHFDGLKITE